eukprot:TRINITY_DN4371_c0_g2_i3.p1 TRINITY_DN4371_c0_g2~~TRINITY_DN4371_c0_g2_i3.p1  ORF type:complete len:389 (+),score=58.67 TRINITY_DN4371_c0_g2_i3:106-1272(+)
MCSDSNSTTSDTRKRKLSVSCFNINILPSEIMVLILSKLRSPHIVLDEDYRFFEQIEDISLVCKWWRQLSVEPTVWSDYTIYLKEETFPRDLKKLVMPKFSRVHSLKLYGGKSDSSHYADIVFGLYQYCHDCLLKVNRLTENERLQLIHLSKNITKLALGNYHIENDVLQAICSLPKLERLSIWNATFDREPSFENIAKLNALKYFKYCYQDYEYYRLLPFFSDLENLETLELVYFPIIEDVSLLAKLTKLKVLEFHYLHDNSETFFSRLSTLTQIQTLYLNVDHMCEDFDYAHTLTNSLPQLKELTIQAPIPAKQFTSFLTPFLANLEFISIEDDITSSHIESLVLLSPHLHTVVLHCRGITYTDVKQLTEKYERKIKFEKLRDSRY